MSLALPLPKSPNSIWLKFTAVVGNAAPGRTPRGVARHGTARYGTPPSPPPPPRLYFLAGVTRGAYFYGLYYFAFLECALPGVNPRPQFGQCIHVEKSFHLSSCLFFTIQEGFDRYAPVRCIALVFLGLLIREKTPFEFFAEKLHVYHEVGNCSFSFHSFFATSFWVSLQSIRCEASLNRLSNWLKNLCCSTLFTLESKEKKRRTLLMYMYTFYVASERNNTVRLCAV